MREEQPPSPRERGGPISGTPIHATGLSVVFPSGCFRDLYALFSKSWLSLSVVLCVGAYTCENSRRTILCLSIVARISIVSETSVLFRLLCWLRLSMSTPDVDCLTRMNFSLFSELTLGIKVGGIEY